MIIDFHTHCFPDDIAAIAIDKLSRMSRSRAFTDGTLTGLIASMKKSGIDTSVILPVATHAGQVEKINAIAARLNEAYAAQGLMSFGGIHPDYADYKRELARLSANGIKGIKIHPVYQFTDINDLKFLRILHRAAELDLTVVTHAGQDIGFPGEVRCSPPMIRSAVDEIGAFKFVLAHMGGWRDWDLSLKYLADTKVYIDTAFSFGEITPRPDEQFSQAEKTMLDENAFMRFFAAFGAERILFGTDSPWSAQNETRAFIENLPIEKSAKEQILGKNAQKLLEVSVIA